MIRAAVLDTPPGPLSILAEEGTVVAAGFTAEPDELAARLDARRRTVGVERLRDLGPITDAVSAYLGGDVGALDGIPVAHAGTPHQQAVWAALRRVPAGRRVSYAELAELSGRPNAVRAVGTACGRNLIAPIVPCHRIVRRDGALGGYYYGLAYKRWLLAHEQHYADAPSSGALTASA